jgi:prepilin-type N-terminal cleavage/methylation domain-containing protein
LACRTRFTLVELLVVLAIIAVLAAILLPTLRRAKQRARDVACMAAMRQGLVAVFTYNGDYPRGLQNSHPRCSWWGEGWYGPVHRRGSQVVENGVSYDLEFNQCPVFLFPGANDTWVDGSPKSSHGGSEGGALDNWWRGYLLLGKYATAATLGCGFTDYRKSPYFRGGHRVADGWGQAQNQVEYDRTCSTQRQFPAFVWWGPGTMAEKVRSSHELHMSTSGFQDDLGLTNSYGCTSYRRQRGPLFSCGRTCLTEYWNAYYWWDESKHRPDDYYVKTGIGVTNIYRYGYAENVGYSDGAVRFFTGAGPARYDPFSR